MKRSILVVDIGGTHIKVLAADQPTPIKIPSGPTLTPRAAVTAVQRATRNWKYECIAIGYPGVITAGRITAEPKNLGRGWVGFDFSKAFGAPTRLVNDAAMQALGAYRGGRMLFLGFGTGLGSALVIDDVLVPLELGHLPYRGGQSYEDYVGARAFERSKHHWRRHATNVIGLFQHAFEVNDTVLGGGNAMYLDPMPAGTRLVDERAALTGGERLWGNQSPG